MRLRIYLQSVGLSTIIAALIVGASSVTPVGVVLLPGMLLAALVFPTGINSDYGYTHIILAALSDIFIVSLPMYFYLRWRSERKQP